MVIHHVKDNSNTYFMKCVHHLLELADTAIGVVGIGRVTTLGHVIVHRVVTPVIFVITKTCLVHRAIIIARQDMYRVDTQGLQMFDGPRLSQCQELSWILCIRTRYRKVTMVQFIDNQVGRRLDNGMLVAAPMFRERFFFVNDSTTLAIDAYSLCKDTWALTSPHIECIELVHQVASCRCSPEAIL